jgi:MOSC domain-containing protein YiiM
MNDRAPSEPGGRLIAIHIAATAGAPILGLDRVAISRGSGLRGDRYATRAGHWSPNTGVDREVTLVEQEEVERLAAETGVVLQPGELRRNLTTSGVRLNDLLGSRFRVGAVILEGTRLCEPCLYLQTLLGKPVLEPLIHRAGLRARIVEGGEIRVGDPVSIV